MVLKQAEKLIRQGKLDGAIQEYVRLVADQPRDWASLNALGDLYVRAGAADRAVEQFTRIADHLFNEGFLPKAAALYKKALKTKGDDEHTLLQLVEVASRQGLLADARAYLRILAKQRQDRGDASGALECQVKLGSFEDADPELQAAGGRAAQSLNNIAHAVRLYKEAARGFEKRQRPADALDALAEACRLDPSDLGLREQLIRECLTLGQVDRAKDFLTRESAGDNPDLLLMLGRIELVGGRDLEGRVALTRLLMVAPDRRPAVLSLAEELAAGGHADAAYGCAELVVDDSVLSEDWGGAIAALQAVIAQAPHIPALIKLVEVSVDAGRDEVMRDAQARLADAYLAAGRGAEARGIAEDLVAHDPSSERNVQRLRQALELTGVTDVEAIIAKYREPAETFDDWGSLEWTPDGAGDRIQPPIPDDTNDVLAAVDETGDPFAAVDETDDLLTADGEKDDPPSPPGEMEDLFAAVGDFGDVDAEESSPIAAGEEPIRPEPLEVDLSDALARLAAADQPPTASSAPSATIVDLEEVFEGLRGKAERELQVAEALDQFERGVSHLEHGREEQAIAELRNAARTPILRFPAAARLGRLHLSRGELEIAIDWLERAAEAPAPALDEGLAVLYDLAAALQQVGESARALAILMEIGAETTEYRDVPQRIERLRVEAGGGT